MDFWEALRFWLKMGFIGLAGPANHIAVMPRDLVEQWRWICELRFLHALNGCMLLPGPEAQQLATRLGGCSTAHGWRDRWGAVPRLRSGGCVGGWAKAWLVTWQGWSGTLAAVGWLSPRPPLDLGGAHAELPEMHQDAAVEQAWLLGPQMIDGLALGGTTPGPRIMVVAFEAFQGGWGQRDLGPDALCPGTALAAVVTWFTGLPTFRFIPAGGALVTSTQGKLHFAAPLTAITAVVVLAASLALFFPSRPMAPDCAALVLAVFAAVAWIRFHAGRVPRRCGLCVGCLGLAQRPQRGRVRRSS